MYTLAGVDQTDYPTPAPTNPTPTPTVQHLTVVDEYFIGGLVVANSVAEFDGITEEARQALYFYVGF